MRPPRSSRDAAVPSVVWIDLTLPLVFWHDPPYRFYGVPLTHHVVQARRISLTQTIVTKKLTIIIQIYTSSENSSSDSNFIPDARSSKRDSARLRRRVRTMSPPWRSLRCRNVRIPRISDWRRGYSSWSRRIHSQRIYGVGRRIGWRRIRLRRRGRCLHLRPRRRCCYCRGLLLPATSATTTTTDKTNRSMIIIDAARPAAARARGAGETPTTSGSTSRGRGSPFFVL